MGDKYLLGLLYIVLSNNKKFRNLLYFLGRNVNCCACEACDKFHIYLWIVSNKK